MNPLDLQADVERLARYFAQRYGGDDRLLETRKALDPEAAAPVTLLKKLFPRLVEKQIENWHCRVVCQK